MQSPQPKPDSDDIADLPPATGVVILVPKLSSRPLDDSAPTPVRQAQLRALYQQNISAGRAPYAQVTIWTRGEFSWVMQERGWSGDDDPQGKARADWREAIFEGTDLREVALLQANLSHANLRAANLSNAVLHNANLQDALMVATQLRQAALNGVQAQRANLLTADLQGAYLTSANLTEANLRGVDLQGAILQSTTLHQTDLGGAKLDGANLRWAILRRANLNSARFNDEAVLAEIKLDRHTYLGDISWKDVPLTQVDWEQVLILGEEEHARRLIVTDKQGKRRKKTKSQQTEEYHLAVRTCRQLALTLRGQGMNEVADRFAFRAHVLQRELLWLEAGLPIPGFKRSLKRLPHRLRTCWLLLFHYFHAPHPRPPEWSLRGIWQRRQQQRKRLRILPALERKLVFPGMVIGQRQAITPRPWYKQVRPRKLGAWLWSFILTVIAGYGYKPARSLLIYLCIIFGFMGLYLLNSHFIAPHLSWDQALVLSVSCFHGRGFFEQDITLGSTYARLAAGEAVIGLLIEISFIATFTQRFFGR